MTLDFSLNRVIEIRARKATVFRFFTDPERWARWWGAGSTIDARVGGAVLIVYPGGRRASGVVTDVVADERIAFTYGYEGEGASIAPGGSRVTITLADASAGAATRLELRHDVDSQAIADEHVQGWRHQLARFAAVVGDDAFAAAADHVRAWVEAWNQADLAQIRALLEPAVAADVRFRDAHGDVYGLDELVGHVAAVQRFMPGLRLEARGELRRAHDTALADWAIVGPGSAALMTGTNVVRFAGDGRIAEVVGIGAA